MLKTPGGGYPQFTATTQDWETVLSNWNEHENKLRQLEKEGIKDGTLECTERLKRIILALKDIPLRYDFERNMEKENEARRRYHRTMVEVLKYPESLIQISKSEGEENKLNNWDGRAIIVQMFMLLLKFRNDEEIEQLREILKKDQEFLKMFLELAIEVPRERGETFDQLDTSAHDVFGKLLEDKDVYVAVITALVKREKEDQQSEQRATEEKVRKGGKVILDVPALVPESKSVNILGLYRGLYFYELVTKTRRLLTDTPSPFPILDPQELPADEQLKATLQELHLNRLLIISRSSWMEPNYRYRSIKNENANYRQYAKLLRYLPFGSPEAQKFAMRVLKGISKSSLSRLALVAEMQEIVTSPEASPVKVYLMSQLVHLRVRKIFVIDESRGDSKNHNYEIVAAAVKVVKLYPGRFPNEVFADTGSDTYGKVSVDTRLKFNAAVIKALLIEESLDKKYVIPSKVLLEICKWLAENTQTLNYIKSNNPDLFDALVEKLNALQAATEKQIKRANRNPLYRMVNADREPRKAEIGILLGKFASVKTIEQEIPSVPVSPEGTAASSPTVRIPKVLDHTVPEIERGKGSRVVLLSKPRSTQVSSPSDKPPEPPKPTFPGKKMTR